MTRRPKRGGHAPARGTVSDNSTGLQTSNSAHVPSGGQGGYDENNIPSSSPWSKRIKPRLPDRSGMASKRKAFDGNPHTTRPARRQRTDRPSFQYDFASITRNMTLPTRSDVPRMPRELLSNPKTIRNSLGKYASFDQKFVHVSQTHSQCIVYCNMEGKEPMEVMGEGSNQKLSERAAYLHLVSKLYQAGVFGEIFEVSERINHQTMKEEKDAKIDIYDYAARYQLVPRFSILDGHRPSQFRKRRVVEVIIELPEQSISVSAKAASLQMAEIAAALKFKKEAENYQSTQGTDSLVVRDSTALSVANARHFFEFYKDIDRNANINVELKGNSGTWNAQAMLNNQAIGEEIVITGNKTKAQDLAYLTAAVSLTKDDPSLLPRFIKALRAGNGQILRLTAPITMTINDNSMYAMEDTLLAARKAGLSDDMDDLEIEQRSSAHHYNPRPSLGTEAAQKRSTELLEAYHAYQSRPDLEKLRSVRKELPMSQYASKVLDIVDKNIYSIIIGATGSGKTTQVPQILLDRAIVLGEGAACNIVCTQPRRIAATSVARRVAEERAENLQNTVGYHVRFDPKPPKPGGSVTYCTTGILLQQLQHNPDDVLDKVSHLVIDEVHERDMLIDFLLIVIKKVMAKRIKLGKPTPKVILMSATIDSELFASYFKNIHPTLGKVACPTLSVPGRTFPVREQYLEEILETLDKQYGAAKLKTMYSDQNTREYLDYERTFAKANPLTQETNGLDPSEEAIIDWKRKTVVSADGEESVSTEKEDGVVPLGLIATTISHIATTTAEGAILVFLPGLDEMVKVDAILRQDKPLGIDMANEEKYKTFMLHSSIQDSQKSVFDPVPAGCRKIILGTNIAETSITIPDVQFVVDAGKLREKRYDQLRRITKLQCTWASKSNSKQRAGRAGRVQNGHYYALFSKQRYTCFRAVGLPELLRSDLQETCLDVKAQAFEVPVRQFLADAIEPPNPVAVETAVDNLISLDALTEDEQLTALGRLLSSLPVHPSLGKMIVLGMIFRCLDPMIVLGASAGERQLFTSPLEARAAAKQAKLSFVRGSGSDHLATLNAFNELRYLQDAKGQYAMQGFARQNFLHTGAFQSIASTASQIEGILIDAGLVPRHSRKEAGLGGSVLNENSNKLEIVKALAVAGLHPNLGLSTNNVLYRTPGEKNCLIHPSSVNGTSGSVKDQVRSKSYIDPKLVTYTTLAKSNDGHSTFMRDSTIVQPLMAALFGGRLNLPVTSGRVVEMDGWLQFFVRSDVPKAVKTLVEFRRGLERMQTEAFRDLSKKQSIADNEVRQLFAKGLVEILNSERLPQQMGSTSLETGSQSRESGSTSWNNSRSTSRTRDPNASWTSGRPSWPSWDDRAALNKTDRDWWR